ERIRALAVTSKTRMTALPDIPAVGEVVSGYEASQWFGIVAPKGTSPEIVGKLNDAINAGLADAQLQARLINLGQTVFPQSAAEFTQRIVADAEKWANVIKAARINI